MEKFLDILSKLQVERGSIPTYVFFDGIHPLSWIEVEKSLEKNNESKIKEIDIVLNSSGGTADEAYKIIRAFRGKYDTVNVVVPFWAKSAATLLSFGASRLVLHGRGELGPIDAQIKKDDEKIPEGEISSALIVQSSLAQIEKRSREGMLEMFMQFRKQGNDPENASDIARIGRTQLAEMLLDYSAKFYAPLMHKIEPIEMGKMARVLDIGRMYARRILKQYNNQTSDRQIEDLLLFLVYECPDHGYVVDYNILKSFLPFVIRADEKPFTANYYEHLSSLSLLLMTEEWPKMNGFLSSLSLLLKSDNIKENGTDTNSQKKILKLEDLVADPLRTTIRRTLQRNQGDQASQNSYPQADKRVQSYIEGIKMHK